MITEIGGTVGDIESLPFLEAIRQFALDVGRENCLYIHLTLVPYLKAAGELKTKPTQHSVGALRQIGIQPDILICRTEHPISADDKDKIALFCNVERKAVIEERDKQFSIYEVPLSLVKQRARRHPGQAAGPEGRPAGPDRDWREMVDRIMQPQARGADRGRRQVHEASRRLQVGLRVARPRRDRPPGPGARSCGSRPRRSSAEGAEAILGGVDGILVPGGFGMRGIEGKIEAIRYARTQKIPFFGICLGMQMRGRRVRPQRARAARTPTAPSSTRRPQHPVIALMEDQRVGQPARRHDAAGGLALRARARAAWPGRPTASTRSASGTATATSSTTPTASAFEENGPDRHRAPAPTARSSRSSSCADHPWFLAVQFHPEFKSKPTKAHPLFRDFIAAALHPAAKPAARGRSWTARRRVVRSQDQGEPWT